MPYMVSEEYQDAYLDNKYWWCSTRSYEKQYYDGDTSKSDITVLRSAIFRHPANYAIIEFTRPFITSQMKTINFIGSFHYNMYLSWGIFDSKDDWNIYKVKGDVKLSTFKQPDEQRFIVRYPDPPDTCFIFASYLGSGTRILTFIALTIMSVGLF